jgi:hypothetical protein
MEEKMDIVGTSVIPFSGDYNYSSNMLVATKGKVRRPPGIEKKGIMKGVMKSRTNLITRELCRFHE